jgi:mitochondrial fission protein ELM1
MSRVRVWAISDGAAGNERQALALANRLGTVERVLRLQPRWPWRWLAPRRLPLAAQAFPPELSGALAGRLPDLVIGCGRQAALATRLLRERGVPAVQVLAPRISSRHWDLLVAPAHDRLRGDNVIQSIGSLHEIDEAWLARARGSWSQFGAYPAPRTLLLLGGPTRAAPLTVADWQRLAGGLRDALKRDGGSLLASSSRRTPDWLRDASRQAFAGLPGVRWHGEHDGPNPYSGLLAWADRIVVSADSVNLISEACATSAPVYTLLPDRPRGRLAAFHRILLARDRLRPMEAIGQPWSPAPLRELDVIAAEISLRLDLSHRAERMPQRGDG